MLIGKAGEAAGENEVVHNTAGWIGLRYMHLSFMPAVGMSIAVQAMVGRCMGEQRPDLAAKRVWLGLGVACAYMGLCALLFVLFREPLIRLFAEGDPKLTADAIEEVVRVGAMVMIAAAVFQVFDAIAIVLSAALRGAGDTVWPGAVVVGGSFAFIIGGGHLMIALFPQWGSAGPWASTALFIVAVGSALFARFLGGKWRTMSLVEHPGPPGPSPAGESRLAERV